MTHVMLDLETMGTGADAAIVAIGAVAFDENGPYRKFYQAIDIQSALDIGAKIDGSTLMWWLKQGDEARAALAKNPVSIHRALAEFATWLGEPKSVKLWGNGAAFDNVILATAYRLTNTPLPWKFYNDRCYRTIKSLFPYVEMEREGTHHNALDDAVSQAEHLIAIVRLGLFQLA